MGSGMNMNEMKQVWFCSCFMLHLPLTHMEHMVGVTAIAVTCRLFRLVLIHINIVLYFHKRIIYPCFAWTLDIQTKLAANLYVTQIKSCNREALAWTVFLSTYVAYGGSGDDSAAGTIALQGGSSSQDNLGGSGLCSSSGLSHFSLKWYFDLGSCGCNGNNYIKICTGKSLTPSEDLEVNLLIPCSGKDIMTWLADI